MWELLKNLFSPTQYMPHGHCYLWQTPLVWLHVTGDFLIAIAYFSIPAMLIYFICKRRDVPFLGIFALFGAFIILCGTGHLLEIWTLWHSAYWLSGIEKAATALVSCFTAGQMVTLLPQFLSLKTPQELEAINSKLQSEIAVREDAELALRCAYDDLEIKVQERTAQLRETNNFLEMEIRDRKLVEIALQKAVVTADRANRAKSEFLSSMSHELRTPLNAILGFSQVMVRDSSLNNQHQEHLQIINRAGEHLLALINDILEMSKIEAGRSQLNESSFNLIYLLETLEEMFRLKAESKKLQLNFEVVDGVPHFVNGDEGKLRQILINLVGNAINFTETGSVTLRVKNQVEETGSNQSAQAEFDYLDTNSLRPELLCLQFEIEDTGSGIATEEMNKLFEPFEQTKAGYKSQQGTGLGLSISRKFVQMMGGDITISSIPGLGSNFTFDIEIRLADPIDVKIIKPHKKVIGLAPAQPEYRILVVDDWADNCLVIVRLLSPLGILVREARNGQEAITIWEDWQPHLIWMDMQMPVMNGYEATRQIKAHPLGKKTAIVALTASVFEEERKMILAAGCDDFMRKPFEAKILFAKMEELLGIQYIYEEPVEGELDNESKISAFASNQSVESQLCQMPIEWVQKIYDAAHECCDDKIIQLIEEMPREFAPAAQVLTALVHNFLFDDIIDLAKSGMVARQI